MKITAPLLLLPLLLAACGTQSATPTASASTPPSLLGNSVKPSGPTYVEAFEAAFERELVAQGLSGVISAQAMTPKSALTVLKVSDTTARAYMKTTYPAATGCALDWGDGTATSTITTPSVVATDKADHTYTKSGMYTIKLTCGTDIKTSTFTAVVPVTNLNLFDDFVGDPWYGDLAYADNVSGDTNYITQGFFFKSYYTFMMRNYGLASDHIALLQQCSGTTEASNGNLFNVNTLTGGMIFSNVTVTAYDINGNVIGSTQFTNDIYLKSVPAETRVVNWKNVKRLQSTCASGYFVLDDMSATIQPNPQ